METALPVPRRTAATGGRPSSTWPGPQPGYSPLSELINVVDLLRTDHGSESRARTAPPTSSRGTPEAVEYNKAVRLAGLKASRYLAETTVGQTPDRVDTYDLSPVAGQRAAGGRVPVPAGHPFPAWRDRTRRRGDRRGGPPAHADPSERAIGRGAGVRLERHRVHAGTHLHGAEPPDHRGSLRPPRRGHRLPGGGPLHQRGHPRRQGAPRQPRGQPGDHDGRRRGG